MWIPGVGWQSIRPLQYGDIQRFYENHPQPSLARSAALFRTAVPGCEDVTADTVGSWPAGLAETLERAVLAASELLGDVNAEPESDEPAADDAGGGMMAPPDDPIQEVEIVEVDIIHQLHERGYTWSEIYGLLLPEIRDLQAGAARAADRRDDSGESSGGDAPAEGNRGGSHTALFSQ